MAIDSQFVTESGPFLGTSCLPWRHRGKGVRSTLAVNIDFSRGTIRPRRGSALMHAYSASTRVMGMHGYRKLNGEMILAAVVLVANADSGTEFPWKLEFHTINMSGVKTSQRIDTHPYDQPPDPDNWYSMAQFGQKLFISSKKGRTLEYNFSKDPEKPETAEAIVNPGWAPLLTMLETFPSGSISIVHNEQLVVAGFDGRTSHSVSGFIFEEQNYVELDAVELTQRKGITLSPNQVAVSEEKLPSTYVYDRLPVFMGEGAVTGLASTSAGILVLTEQSAWILEMGLPSKDPVSPEAPHSKQKVAVGVGCVGQRTVCRGRGVTAWMAADGFFTFDGKEIRKISDDISELFSFGRWMQPPVYALGDTASKLGYPFVIQKSRLDRACGEYDASTSSFVWAVPVAGFDDYNRLVLSYSPVTDSWAMSAPTPVSESTTTSLRPTNFALLYDRGKYRFVYSDYDTGIYFMNESDYDYDPASASAKDIMWMYQGPVHDLGPGVTSSTRAIQVRQSAVVVATDHASKTGSSPAAVHIEAERNFDMDDDELGSSATLEVSVQKAPPTSATSVAHYWGDGLWGTAKWHRAGVWRARYPVAAVNGTSFRVAFSGDDGGISKHEIRDYSIELQRTRDVPCSNATLYSSGVAGASGIP